MARRRRRVDPGLRAGASRARARRHRAHRGAVQGSLRGRAGAARWRTTASTACCSPPTSTRARSWCCAPIAATCCRPACRSARPTWSARSPRNAGIAQEPGAPVRDAVRPGRAQAARRTSHARAASSTQHPRRARRGREPRRRPHPARLPDADPRHAAHQLLPDRRATAARRATSPSSSTRSKIPDLPLPRPKFEIFVYSPRVEGVHLRMGYVARGGMRWSDRREDFRTEVLGLMKAQNVKNTVIVPVGAKGGFVPKRLPAGGRARTCRRKAIACYQTFIRGLLDVTDNIVNGRIVRAAASGAPRRRRRLPRRRRRQGHGDVLRHRQRHRPSNTASGSATRSPPAARPATTTRRWASPRAAPGSA